MKQISKVIQIEWHRYQIDINETDNCTDTEIENGGNICITMNFETGNVVQGLDEVDSTGDLRVLPSMSFSKKTLKIFI